MSVDSSSMCIRLHRSPIVHQVAIGSMELMQTFCRACRHCRGLQARTVSPHHVHVLFLALRLLHGTNAVPIRDGRPPHTTSGSHAREALAHEVMDRHKAPCCYLSCCCFVLLLPRLAQQGKLCDIQEEWEDWQLDLMLTQVGAQHANTGACRLSC